MKKRSCRRTDEERSVHEQAIRVRKMTDAQLVEHLGHIREEGYAAGYAEAEQTAPTPVPGKSVAAFIEELATGECSGVKSATLYKLTEFARERGYIA